MKKQLIAILILAVIGICTQCACAQNYTPIATKSLGVDSLTQLDKEIWVHTLNIDSKMHQIRVYYDVVLLSNNVFVTAVNSGSYIRDNNTPSQNFNALKSNSLGQGITYLITQDIGKIQSGKTIETDLLQK